MTVSVHSTGGTVERVTIEPSTEDANATQLHNSLLGVTLSRDLEKDTDA